MLPKKNKADKKAVERVFKEGKFINFPNLTFKFLLTNSLNPPRVSIIVPKFMAKKAVDRNFLRRRGYDVFQKHLSKFPAGLLGVFLFKKRPENFLIIENEIKEIFNKIN